MDFTLGNIYSANSNDIHCCDGKTAIFFASLFSGFLSSFFRIAKLLKAFSVSKKKFYGLSHFIFLSDFRFVQFLKFHLSYRSERCEEVQYFRTLEISFQNYKRIQNRFYIFLGFFFFLNFFHLIRQSFSIFLKTFMVGKVLIYSALIICKLLIIA